MVGTVEQRKPDLVTGIVNVTSEVKIGLETEDEAGIIVDLNLTISAEKNHITSNRFDAVKVPLSKISR